MQSPTLSLAAIERAQDRHTIATGTVIDVPCAVVYEFVTNPHQWGSWHPATAAVRAAPHRPLRVGESVVESIRAAGRRFEAHWVVQVAQEPRWWRIETETSRGCARIDYELDATSTGCFFRRTLQYRTAGAWRVLDGTVTRWLLERQSRQALRRLRALLEARHAAPEQPLALRPAA